MILIDSRVGSKELVTLIDDAVLVELESGDACFVGNGKDGKIDIGIERKTVGDLIGSVISGRLSGLQIPELVKQYDRVYLILEGVCKEDSTGCLRILRGTRWIILTKGTRKFTYEGIWNYLTTLEELAGVVVRNTANVAATAALISQLYHWWSKPYSSHKGLNQIYKRPPPAISFRKPSLLRVLASDLPHIGYDLSKKVEEYFGTIEAMMAASEEDWRKIEGVGKGIAREVWGAIHARRKNG